MKIIDQALRNAFIRMRAALKTNDAIASILGVSGAHVGRIINGKTLYLEDETWKRAEPVLSKYLRKEDSGSNVAPVFDAKVRAFPVISEAAAASCNTTYWPIAARQAKNVEVWMTIMGRGRRFV